MSTSGIYYASVHKKGWGREEWIYNGPEGCGKKLYFDAGKKCSWHYHILKSEVFHLQSGSLLLRYGWSDNIAEASFVEMHPGDCFVVPVGLRHQMWAYEDSCLLEFSTQHFESDSIRIEKGD